MSADTAASPAAARPAPPEAVPDVPRLPFGLFLGLRYLQPRRTFVSVITIISMLGVALGIALPIIVIAVMTGYDRELKSKVLGFDPHIEVTNGALIEDWRTVRGQIEGTPGVVAAAPYVMGPILAEFNNRRVAPKIRGVDPALEGRVIDLKALMGQGSEGKFDLAGDKAVVGADLAKILHIAVGDTLTLYSPRNLEGLTRELKSMEGKNADADKIAELRSMVSPVEVTVTGIFNSGRYLYDAEFIFVPLHLGQELYELGGRVHGVSVKTVDAYHAETVKHALDERFLREASVPAPPAPGATPAASASASAAEAPAAPALPNAANASAAPATAPRDEPPAGEEGENAGLEPPHAQTWMELNAQFFNAVRSERAVMFVITSVVLVVAAFCVMNTLITVTVQKTREIGIMKAVGADVWQIVRVFASQGVVVGLIGTVGGVLLGLGTLAVLNPFKRMMENVFDIQVFNRQVYGFAEIPYWAKPQDVALICVGAFVVCSLAALLPAYLAARLDPVKALRAE